MEFKLTFEEYMKHDGHICPYCGCKVIDVGYEHDKKCKKCRREWIDTFTLTGIEHYREPKKVNNARRGREKSRKKRTKR